MLLRLAGASLPPLVSSWGSFGIHEVDHLHEARRADLEALQVMCDPAADSSYAAVQAACLAAYPWPCLLRGIRTLLDAWTRFQRATVQSPHQGVCAALVVSRARLLRLATSAPFRADSSWMIPDEQLWARRCVTAVELARFEVVEVVETSPLPADNTCAVASDTLPPQPTGVSLRWRRGVLQPPSEARWTCPF